MNFDRLKSNFDTPVNTKKTSAANPFSDDDDEDLFGDDNFLEALDGGGGDDANEGINGVGMFVGETKNDGTDPQLSRNDYDFSDGLKRCLRERFGIHQFRPNQVRPTNCFSEANYYPQ